MGGLAGTELPRISLTDPNSSKGRSRDWQPQDSTSSLLPDLDRGDLQLLPHPVDQAAGLQRFQFLGGKVVA